MILNSLCCFSLKVIKKNMALYFVRSPFFTLESHFYLDVFAPLFLAQFSTYSQ